MADFQLAAPNGSARVRSFWIVRAGEDFPLRAEQFLALHYEPAQTA